MNEKKCIECIYHGAKVDQSSCWACTNYDLFRKMDQPIVKPIQISTEGFEDVYSDIKKHFKYKDSDPIVYSSKTLNEQLNDWIEELKREQAKQILQEADDKLNELALEYYNAGKQPYYCVCEVIHHKVISKILKKYTGEQTE